MGEAATGQHPVIGRYSPVAPYRLSSIVYFPGTFIQPRLT